MTLRSVAGGQERRQAGFCLLRVSFCLHSHAIGQNFNEFGKLDPRSGSRLVTLTITAKTDNFEKLPLSRLGVARKSDISSSRIGYPLSAFLAVNGDEAFATGDV